MNKHYRVLTATHALAASAGLIAMETSCVAPPPPEPPVSSWSAIKVEEKSVFSVDDFEKIQVVRSPVSVFEANGSGSIVYQFTLVAMKIEGMEKTLGVGYSLILESRRTYTQSWAFWKAAADKDGHRFLFAPGGETKDVGGALYERARVQLSREYLESIKATGTRWRVYANDEQKEFTIPPNLVAGFLAKCDDSPGFIAK